MTNVESSIERLKKMSFVASTAEGRDFWAVAEPAEWAEANAVGDAAASDLLTHMREFNAPNLLGSVVRAMLAKGRYGGVEVGFLTRIAAAAL